MSKVLVENNTLVNIADAIRSKTGKEDKMKPGQMAEEIGNIETGGADSLGTFLNTVAPEIVTAKNTNLVQYSFYLGSHYSGKVFNFNFPELLTVERTAFEGFSSSSLTKVANFIAPKIQNIDQEAFKFCAISNIDVSNVSTLGSYCFAYSTISNATLDLSCLTNCAYGAFYKTSGFTTALIGTNNSDTTATDYRGGLMYQSANLQRVEIKASSIKDESFRYCSKLTEFVIRKENAIITLEAVSAFKDTPIASGTGYIYVPDALLEKYEVATNWVSYADQLKPLSELEA